MTRALRAEIEKAPAAPSGTPHVRDVLDRFYTLPALAVACVAALPDLAPLLVVEPSVGGGAFAGAVAARWPHAHIHGVDIDPLAPGLAICDSHDVCSWLDFDARDLALSAGVPIGLIVGNPPYGEAEAHVRAALVAAPRGTVAMLLRLGFLAGGARGRSFWPEHPPNEVHVISRRPSFTGNGRTDGQEYGWFVWNAGDRPAAPTLHWLDWA